VQDRGVGLPLPADQVTDAMARAAGTMAR
jgi:hypothetical protein